jgi:Na+/H+ antiporter NhaD/arsenite permease-like protein
LIGIHHRLEVLLDLPSNILLFTIPIISSAIIMLLRFDKAQQYVQKDVEWGTLLFFIFLFAKAGTLKYTGASDVLAQKFSSLAGNNSYVLTSILLWVSSLTSSIIDNVIVVASFIPIVQSFQSLGFVFQKLWWALLFGACFGGNITLVGSTANIVALGILEKERNIKITFLNWFWVGLSTGIITTGIAWLYLLFFK